MQSFPSSTRRPESRRGGLVALLCLLASLLPQRALAQAADSKFWVPNNGPSSIAQVGNTIYIGGSFTLIGPATGGAVPTDPATGAATPSLPKVSGSVRAIIPDGAGGWYIGGQFTSVGGLKRLNLARINANLSVNPWDPNSAYASYSGALGYITSLVLTGSTLWVGGNYDAIGGTSRAGLAAVDATTGSVSTFDPGLGGGPVSSLLLNGSTLYVCGGFSTLLGQSRSGAGAFDVTTGTPTAFDPHSDNRVLTMALVGSTIYLGGVFTQVGGQTRHHLAAVDATTGAVDPAWDPNTDDAVLSLAASGGVVYAGGSFNSVGGVFQQALAAIDGATGALTPSQPAVGGLPGFGLKVVNTLVADGSTLYLGGQFGQLIGVERLCAGAIDLGTMTVTSWNPRASQQVFAVLPGGSYVYIGGIFTSVGAVSRTFAAAIDATTGQPTPWSPMLDASVDGIATDGSRVYLAGNFTQANGHNASRVIALDATSGNLIWDANCYGAHRLAVDGPTVYIGGGFTSVGGQSRTSIASVDAATGGVTAWNPGASPGANVMSLAVNGSTVYVGGSFSQMGGQARNNLAALNTSDGSATAWNPNADGNVQALVAKGCTIFAGGRFHYVNGIERDGVAAIDAATGVPTSWNPTAPQTSQDVEALALAGTTLYVAGEFSSFGTSVHTDIAAVDVTTGAVSAWSPNLDALVLSLAVSGSTVYAGGYFDFVNQLPQANFAAIDRGGVLDGPYSGCSSGNVTGHVTVDCPAAGAPVPGSSIQAIPSGSSTPTATATTDATGSYSIPSLPSGNYTITVVPPPTYAVAVGSQPITVAGGTSTVNFTLQRVLAITASAGAGGSVAPSGGVPVNCGASQTFTISADACHTIADVAVDGASVGAVTSYSFANVTANHTIAATFALTTYTIAASAGAGGTIAPSGSVSVGCGGSKTFAISADACHGIGGVAVDGVAVGAVASYTFANVTASHTIAATFVPNPAPIATMTAPTVGTVVSVGAPVSFAGSFSDNSGDTHTASWTLGSLPPVAGAVNEQAGTVSASYTFTAAGVYMVTLTVTDQCGGSSAATQVGGFDAMVVVYDPSAGFVTGGGWINSPPGAFTSNSTLTGKANFGFVSKYEKGKTVPTGDTEFQFRTASLDFHSTSYNWLVISGAKAQYKGSGTINGSGDYGFMLTAIDGAINGGGGVDKLRMKIFDKSTNAVIYDNQLAASDNSDPTTALGGGSIVIHSTGGSAASLEPLFPPSFDYSLSQNQPNPFQGDTEVDFSLRERSAVSLDVYDLAGREVGRLVDGELEAGVHSVVWSVRDRSGTPAHQGVYFLRMTTTALRDGSHFTAVRRMVVL